MDEFAKNYFWTCIAVYSLTLGLNATPLAGTVVVYFLFDFDLLLSIIIAGGITINQHSARLQELQKQIPAKRLKFDTLNSENLKETTPKAIDINRTTEAELAQLAIIGPILAKGIIKERNKSPFVSLDDVQVRCNLKPHQTERLRSLIIFESSKDKGILSKVFNKDSANQSAPAEREKVIRAAQKKGRIVDY